MTELAQEKASLFRSQMEPQLGSSSSRHQQAIELGEKPNSIEWRSFWRVGRLSLELGQPGETEPS